MKQLHYQITLRQPVYARALGGDPNSGVSLNYIPGSLLRGVLLFKYAEKSGVDIRNLNAADPAIRKLFLGGATRFLNAYPVYENQRALPIPHSWQQPKKDKMQVYDFAVEEPAYEIASNCRGVSAAFWCKENGEVVFVKPERVLAVHNRRNREYGRAMEPANMENKEDDKGEVFRYEALAASQVFRGLILCDDPDAIGLHSLLSGEIFLGGSRAAGYGLADLTASSSAPENYSREVGENLPNPLPDLLTFTLLSDALIRDDHGQFSADIETLKHHICRRLGIDAAQIVDVSYLRSIIVGGFNRKWGLPLPQTIAVSMGSVIKLRGVSCPQDKLIDLETKGIGERRAEGFGRIVVNWPSMKENFEVKKRDAVPRATALGSERPTVNGDGAQKMAKMMIKRVLRQQMDEKLVELTQNLKFSTGNIRKSQISRLRNVIQNLSFGDPDPEQRLRDYFERLEKRGSVRMQFEATRDKDGTLLQWLKKTADSTMNEKWLALFKINQEMLPTIGNIRIDLSGAEEKPFRIEYLLRYMDLVLAKLAKEVKS